MNRIGRALEWVMTWWGLTTTNLMWSDHKLRRALGLLMGCFGILAVGIPVGLFVLVELAKKKCRRAKSASR